jgi:hypothetical protein
MATGFVVAHLAAIDARMVAAWPLMSLSSRAGDEPGPPLPRNGAGPSYFIGIRDVLAPKNDMVTSRRQYIGSHQNHEISES